MCRLPIIILALLMVLLCGCFRFRTPDKQVQESFAAKGHSIRFGDYSYGEGKTIHYAMAGDSSKPLLFFVHGTPGAWNAFGNYMADSTLLQHFYMISIDRPGFGYTDFGKAQPLLPQAQVFNRMVKDLGHVKPAILLGHSYGSPIIAQMAALDSSVASVVFSLAGSFKPSSDLAGDARGLLYYPPFRWLAPGAFRPSNDELVWFRESILTMPEVLSKIKCAVWLVHGKKDKLVPYADSEYAMQFLSHAKEAYMVTFPSEDHFIPWTRFKEVRTLLLQQVNAVPNPF